MGRERDMLAELPQELAFAARETPLGVARRDQYAEDLALHAQGRRRHRTQAPCARVAGRERDLIQLGLVNQISLHTSRQAVPIDRNARLCRHAELPRRPSEREPTAVVVRFRSSGS